MILSFFWKWSKIAAKKKSLFFLLILPYKACWKPCFPMDERPLVEGYIANSAIYLDIFEFLHFGLIFFVFFRKKGFLGILGPPYCGIGATIRIGREMLCLQYEGFFLEGVIKFNWFCWNCLTYLNLTVPTVLFLLVAVSNGYKKEFLIGSHD